MVKLTSRFVSAWKRLRLTEILTVLAIAVVAAIVYDDQGVRQVAAINFLQSSGARTHDDGQGHIVSVALNNQSLEDRDVIASLAQLPHVVRISLSRSDLAGQNLERLSSLRNLESLSMIDSRLAAQEITRIRECDGLRVLALDGTDTDSATVASLSGLKNLHLLTLARTSVDDSCIDTLAGLNNLKEVDLRCTNVTRQGVERLQALKSNCHIHYDIESDVATVGDESTSVVAIGAKPAVARRSS